MPHNASGAGSPDEWMKYARADLVFARLPLPTGGLYEQLCFHAQQAAEKALKALLVQLGIAVPKTHNLQGLVDLLPSKLANDPVFRDAPRLSIYAVTFRYPGEEEPITEDEYHDALKLAERVIARVDHYLP